jgi:hypothetical protein
MGGRNETNDEGEEKDNGSSGSAISEGLKKG